MLLQDLQTGFTENSVPQCPAQEPSAQSNREDEQDRDSGSKVTNRLIRYLSERYCCCYDVIILHTWPAGFDGCDSYKSQGMMIPQ